MCKSFCFSSLEATGPTPTQMCMCPEHNNSLTSSLQQAGSSFSTAAVKEEASAHYIRPNVAIF